MRKFVLILLSCVALTGCEIISSIIHDDTLVARVGKQKLFISDVQKYIPDYVSSEDSLNLALRYINSWASEILYMETAQSQLSKDEMDVEEELEQYRRSLLKYRYEQRYVNDRLDTLVTQSQIDQFYKEHQSAFTLERPVLRYRYVAIPKNSSHRDAIVKLMSSDKDDDIEMLDKLAAEVALNYVDRSQEWSDILVLAKDADVREQVLMENLKNSYIIISDPSSLEEKIAFVYEIRTSGTAPAEFCKDKIVSMIQSARKHDLLSGLEQDLLQDALERKKFVIY